MNRTLFKYIFLILFVIINIFGINKYIPTVSLLKLYLFLGVVFVLLIFIMKNDLVNLLLLWFVAAMFKELGMIPLPLLPDIFADRIVWVLIVLIFLFDVAFKKTRQLLPITGTEVVMVVFSLFSTISMFSSAYITNEDVKFNFFANGYGIPFTIYFLSKNIVDDEEKIKKVFISFAVVGLYLGLTGIFEILKIDQLVFPGYIVNPMIGLHYGRARGPFLISTVNGAVIGMIIFMSIHLLFNEKGRWKRYFLIITLLCMFVTLVLTYTRACWIAFFIAILIVSIFIPHVRKIFLLICAASVILVSYVFYLHPHFKMAESEQQLISKKAPTTELFINRLLNTSTIEGRIDLYKLNSKLFLKSPIWGNGYGAYGNVKEEFEQKTHTKISKYKFIQKGAKSHDTIVGILVDLGLLGLGLLMYIFFYFFKAIFRLYNKLPQDGFLGKDLAVMFLGMIIVFIINVQTVEIRFFLFVNSMLFSIAGIAVGLYQRVSQGEKRLSREV